jgi:hypothetical protein
MLLTCTSWVESRNTRDDGRGNRDRVKNMLLYHCMDFFSLVVICWRVSLRKPFPRSTENITITVCTSEILGMQTNHCDSWHRYNVLVCVWGDTRWHSWLRHCATSRKVAGSIPDGVIGIFHWHNPSGHTMAHRWRSLWQKWVPGIFRGGHRRSVVRLITLPPSCADCLEIWEPRLPGTLRACPGL